jgi:hypothetical protein
LFIISGKQIGLIQNMKDTRRLCFGIHAKIAQNLDHIGCFFGHQG